VEIAQPGRAGGEPGEHEENPASGRDFRRILKAAICDQNAREHDNDDDRADEGREIGIDLLDADLGEDRRQRGEQGGKKRPSLPR
jgi:hypothetical protein